MAGSCPPTCLNVQKRELRATPSQQLLMLLCTTGNALAHPLAFGPELGGLCLLLHADQV